MNDRRRLVGTNLVALVILLMALLAGWWDAAAVGLGVLVIMDVWVLLRARSGSRENREE